MSRRTPTLPWVLVHLLLLGLGPALAAAERPIRVLHVADYPPYEFLDSNGQPAGAFIDLYRRWGQEVGRPVEFVCMPFDQELEALAAGRADVLTAMTDTPERRATYAYGAPLAQIVDHIVSNRDLPPVAVLADLAGERVGVVAGEVTAGLVSAAGGVPVTFPSYESLVRGLVEGRIGRIVTDTEVVWHYLTRMGVVGRFTASELPLTSDDFKPAVRHGDEAMLALVTRGMAAIPEPERQRILLSWLPMLRVRHETFPWQPVLLWGGAALALALAVIAGFALLNAALRARVARAVEELRATEDQLRQAQKMDALGQLAGGIAHDFNNLLTGILGHAELAGLATTTERARPHVRAVISAGERAAALVQQLVTFARRGGSGRQPTDLHQLVAETVALAQHSIGPRIAIGTRLEARRPMALANAALAQSALLNLLLNARDAQPDGGSITIASRVLELDREAAHALNPALAPGRYVELAVGDTGQGIPPQLLARIFDPFFTTKAPGRGTGLGLSAVYGTMREHGGAVTVESRQGAGSTFRLLFPATDHDPMASSGEHRAVAGAGRVLVVDDEEAVRNVAADALRAAGWTVDTADDGEEALAKLGRGHPYRLVVIDLVMPRLHGDEVLRRLRAAGDRVPALVCSGFVPADHRATLEALGHVRVLAKPYRLADLSREAAELAEEPAPDGYDAGI